LSNPYITLRNRAGFLIETHMLKDYETRVKATYDLVLAALIEMTENGEQLIKAVATEDQRCLQMGKTFNPENKFPLTFQTTEVADSIVYRAYQFEKKFGPISGQDYFVYQPIPWDVPTVYYNSVKSKLSVAIPQGYLIPKQWKTVIDVVQAHGIEIKRLQTAITDTFECYRFEKPTWQSSPYEGRHRVNFTSRSSREEITFPAGTVYVPVSQVYARLVLNLLEPDAPDALIRWGFFNTIFERKEYFESYVMEPMAQKMVENDRELKVEFEARLASDSTFAADPYQRLLFFYQRTPYWDQQKNLYPVVRVINWSEKYK